MCIVTSLTVSHPPDCDVTYWSRVDNVTSGSRSGMMSLFGHVTGRHYYVTVTSLFIHVIVTSLSGRVTVTSLGGHLTVTSLSGQVTVMSLSGRVTVTSLDGHIKVTSLSGHVTVTPLLGHVIVTSLIGHVMVDCCTWTRHTPFMTTNPPASWIRFFSFSWNKTRISNSGTIAE